jgi:hypothetical protein
VIVTNTTFEETPEQLKEGIRHVRQEVVPSRPIGWLTVLPARGSR